ncbi:alanyl-tRNA editing protein [Thermococcus thioreducens]|uniref:Alanyl-tRNA editing protein AlaX n=1 Tax=Thermococcus thioreducens TaxID=277988 RepID=A0A0Q2QPS0_9EURY|nr:DHHA1 domain-containing protein [Thermococcus thioreducens]ASJ11502.1 alanyl-tRNA editing protein AlaX [Thermococcus thioreducens]KQH81885.1 alanyl-tRNA editing protein AlaX [Thermococcus thioreducens]SEW05528.1 alanyl-tRNA synthetase [Thermococcus thioreducens]
MTEKLFYANAYLWEAGATVQKAERDGKNVKLLLDRTIFYPEGGGQPSDRGIIVGEGFRIIVEKVDGKDEIWHEGKLEGRLPEAGEPVRLILDAEWRYENMRQHTGQHILSAVFKDLYDANTTGFQIFEAYNKIEIDYLGELTWEMIFEVEKAANGIVWSDLPVEVEVYEELPDELRKKLRKELSDKVQPPIRIVSIPGVDVIPCGGTHVRSTREVGIIKVVNFYRKSRKLWRIEFVCGNRALKYLDELMADYWLSLDEMSNKNRPLVERVKELKAEMEKLEEEKDGLRRELWRWKAKALLDNAEEINGIRVVSYIEDAPMKDAQAFVVYLVDKNPGTVALVAGENYAIFAKNREVGGISMRDLLGKVLSEVGGGGGGSETLARGGGFKVRPEEVLETARRALSAHLG